MKTIRQLLIDNAALVAAIRAKLARSEAERQARQQGKSK